MKSPFTISILIMVGMLACSSEPADKEPALETAAPAEQTGLKPPSELALLMREMTAFSDSTRKHLKRGEPLLAYPEHFKAMHTATPTDGKIDMDRATYDAFADIYLKQVKALYDAVPADRDDVFNSTLSSCANCHTVVCPGPMQKINKMYVK